MEHKSIQMNLFEYFSDTEAFTLSDAQNAVLNFYGQDVKEPSIRARIYEGIDKGLFSRISKGVYSVTKENEEGKESTCLLINGDGRNLSMLKDNSIDCILTDHPYHISKSQLGGNRNLANYDCFRYNVNDFKEKYRVLKPGGFLIEFLPERNEVNIDYLNDILNMARKCNDDIHKPSFEFYSVVPWRKKDFIINQGRKSKNTEDIYFFTKGKARALRLDNKKNLALAKANNIDVKGMTSGDVAQALTQQGLEPFYMSGTNGMLPTVFDVPPPSKKDRIHQAEKPIELLEEIIDFVTLPNELVLDSFAGSGNTGISSLNKNRNAILIEKDKDVFETMKQNIERALNKKAVPLSEEEEARVDAEIKCYSDAYHNLATTNDKSPLADVIKTATTNANQQKLNDDPMINILTIKSWEKPISDDLTLKRLYVQIKWNHQPYSIFYDFNHNQWGCKARLSEVLDYEKITSHILWHLNLQTIDQLAQWKGQYKYNPPEMNK